MQGFKRIPSGGRILNHLTSRKRSCTHRSLRLRSGCPRNHPRSTYQHPRQQRQCHEGNARLRQQKPRQNPTQAIPRQRHLPHVFLTSLPCRRRQIPSRARRRPANGHLRIRNKNPTRMATGHRAKPGGIPYPTDHRPRPGISGHRISDSCGRRISQ